MAQALARLGIEVTGFDAFARVAGLSDPQVNEAARALLRGEIEVHLGAPAELGGTGNGNGVRVTAGPACADVDRVLVAIGRRPNLDGLGLDRLGVALEADGRPFCDPRTMQLGDLPVFIAGDAIPHRAIFHEAADEGWIAGHNATRSRAASFARRTRLDIVFTDPELAVVGQPFAEVDPDETVVGEAALAGQARMQLSGQDHGLIRVYANRDSGRVVGAELCAPGGEHLAHLLALAVQQRLTVTDLLRLPFYHPTIEEALHRALFDAAKRLPAVAEPDLAACERPRADALA